MAILQKTCAVEGCNGDPASAAGGARGWCRKHYKRWKRNGDPQKTCVSIGGATGKCSVGGCEKRARAKGMCCAHERRLRLYGCPNGKPNGRTTSDDAYQWLVDHKIHDSDDCLIWPFQRAPNGYGHLRTPDGKRTTASRAMCILANGSPKSTDAEAAHNCGNGHEGCVHPQHLRWATRSENQMDRVRHGTSNRGSRHGVSKLSPVDVVGIRLMLKGHSQRSVALEFGVSQSAIWHLSTGKTWSHL